jgi:Cu2+-exporting ATPase
VRIGVTPAQLDAIAEAPGAGVEGHVDGVRVRLGRTDWVGAMPHAADEDDASLLTLAFRYGEQPAVRIAFADPLRPDAEQAIAWARQRGLDVAILSGDRPAAVAHVARQLRIADWHAAMSPAEKLAHVNALAATGRRVLVVGDGLNDAPMLAAGHASIAPATASDAGQTAADMIFLADSLMAVPRAIDVAHRAEAHVRQNITAATLYNIVAVPIAIAGLATPLIAAVAMSASSIMVVANALRLRTRL